MTMRFASMRRSAPLSPLLITGPLIRCPFATASAGARPKVILEADVMGVPGARTSRPPRMLAEDKRIPLPGISFPTGDGWRNEELAHVLRALGWGQRYGRASTLERS
jgi:hypothetical protein